jgi:adenylate cyclase class 2
LEKQSQPEIELKFPLAGPGKMRKRLLELGFVSRGKLFEYNLVLDTPGRDLDSQGRLLRLRSAEGVKLTYKEPLEEGGLSQRFKAKKESELELSSLDTMRHIFHRLGFTAERVYEKYREHFTRENDVSAEIDKLPHMGWFLELEASPEKIEEIVESLGLQMSEGLRENYFELYTAYCRKMGRKAGDMRFSDQEKDSSPVSKPRKKQLPLEQA